MGGAYVLPWLPIHRHQLHYRQYLTRVLAPFALAYDFRQFLFRPLSDDAIVASEQIAGMSDRGLRRLFDRLMELGAVRELSGRPTFRIYGL